MISEAAIDVLRDNLAQPNALLARLNFIGPRAERFVHGSRNRQHKRVPYIAQLRREYAQRMRETRREMREEREAIVREGYEFLIASMPLSGMAAEAGFEPATSELTARRSTS